MPLRPELLATVSQPDLKVRVGDVWWLPAELAFYPGGKGRFCLVVALESAAGAQRDRSFQLELITLRGQRGRLASRRSCSRLEKQTCPNALTFAFG